MAFKNETPDQMVLASLGERLARQRLERNLTQDELARQAGVSKRTLIRLENGESSQMTNLIRVLRALGLLNHLDALVPMPLPSPLEQLKFKRKERRRASPNTNKPGTQKPGITGKWAWDDEPKHDQNTDTHKSGEGEA